MKWWAIIFLFLFAGLQIRLWSEDRGIAHLRQVEAQVAEQKSANDRLRVRNADLRKQVKALHTDQQAIEQYARLHLGMIKPGETFYRFIPAKKP